MAQRKKTIPVPGRRSKVSGEAMATKKNLEKRNPLAARYSKPEYFCLIVLKICVPKALIPLRRIATVRTWSSKTHTHTHTHTHTYQDMKGEHEKSLLINILIISRIACWFSCSSFLEHREGSISNCSTLSAWHVLLLSSHWYYEKRDCKKNGYLVTAALPYYSLRVQKYCLFPESRIRWASWRLARCTEDCPPPLHVNFRRRSNAL